MTIRDWEKQLTADERKDFMKRFRTLVKSIRTNHDAYFTRQDMAFDDGLALAESDKENGETPKTRYVMTRKGSRDGFWQGSIRIHFDTDSDEDDKLALANAIKDEAEKVGFVVVWDGNTYHNILVEYAGAGLGYMKKWAEQTTIPFDSGYFMDAIESLTDSLYIRMDGYTLAGIQSVFNNVGLDGEAVVAWLLEQGLLIREVTPWARNYRSYELGFPNAELDEEDYRYRTNFRPVETAETE